MKVEHKHGSFAEYWLEKWSLNCEQPLLKCIQPQAELSINNKKSEEDVIFKIKALNFVVGLGNKHTL